jgi:hypothetical protein
VFGDGADNDANIRAREFDGPRGAARDTCGCTSIYGDFDNSV